MLREYFTQLKRNAERLNWGRETVLVFVSQYAPTKETYNIIGIRRGECFDIIHAKNVFPPAKISMYGIECPGGSTAKFFNNMFLLLAAVLLVCLQRTEKKGAFLEVLQSRFFELIILAGNHSILASPRMIPIYE